jgi:hypothetical protein
VALMDKAATYLFIHTFTTIPSECLIVFTKRSACTLVVMTCSPLSAQS